MNDHEYDELIQECLRLIGGKKETTNDHKKHENQTFTLSSGGNGVVVYH